MRQPYDSVKAFLDVFLRETKRMTSRPIYFYGIVFAPLFCLVFFTTLMKDGLPHDLPIGLVDMDDSQTSRTIGRTLDSFDATHIVARYANYTEARQAVQRNEIYGFFYLPKGLEQEANSFRQPKVSFYVQYAYLVPGSLLMKDLKTGAVLLNAAAMRKQLRAKGLTDKLAMDFIQPIVVDTHPLNNPSLNYAIYLNNTIVPGIMMLLIFLMTVYAIGNEIKYNSARDWLERSNHSILLALTAKLLPYTLAFTLIGAVVDFTFYVLLDYPCNSGIWPMLAAMVLAIVASQALGIFFIAAIPTLRLAMGFGCLWGVLSFSVCGFTFPYHGFYPFIKGLTYLFPLRHYYLIYVTQALDGFSMAYAWRSYMALACFMLLPLLLLIRLKRNLIHTNYVP